eukprot:scaffold418598_cov35-Prasinocladus_malaysianus.AAC.2
MEVKWPACRRGVQSLPGPVNGQGSTVEGGRLELALLVSDLAPGYDIGGSCRARLGVVGEGAAMGACDVWGCYSVQVVAGMHWPVH